MLLKEKLSPIIIKIVSNNYNQSDISFLVHISKSLAESYLRTQRYYNKLYTQTNHPDELSNMAIDIIAPLFARDDYGCFYELQRFFHPLLKDIEAEESLALIHLRRIVVSKAKQELINVFKQDDPAGWRIYRNLQLAPKRNQNIGVFKDFDMLHYYYIPATPTGDVPSALRPELQEIPAIELEQQLVEFLKVSQKTPDVVEWVLKSLIENDEYRLFVSREKLFHSLKAVWGLQLVSINDYQYTTDRNVYQRQSLLNDPNGLMRDLSLHIQNVINTTYVRKQKMSSKEAAKYVSVLEAYFNDLLSCGSPQKIPQYMNRCTDNGLFKDNWDLHKNRLEYMIRLGKKHLRDLWEQ